MPENCWRRSELRDLKVSYACHPITNRWDAAVAEGPAAILASQQRHLRYHRSEHCQRAEQRIVLAVLPIKLEGESAGWFFLAATRPESRKHSRHAARVFVKFRKLPAQKLLFSADHRYINDEDHH